MLVLLRALLAAVCIAGPPPAAAARGHPDPFARRIVAVAPHVTLLTNSDTSTLPPFEGNVVVIEQTRGLVVVDTGGSPHSGRLVAAAIRSLSAKPVAAIIYTHYHGDHTLGAGALLARWPDARIISTAATRASMTGPPMAYIATYAQGNAGFAAAARSNAADATRSASERAGWQRVADVGPAMVAAYRNLRAEPAAITFDHRLSLPDPVAPVEVRFIGRANTDGDAVVWLPQQRVVATGDVVVAPQPYASASFPDEWLQVLAELEALDFARLIPGHGPVQRDSAYLATLRWAIGSVRDQVSPLARSGVPLADVRKRIDLAPVIARFAGDDGWKKIALDSFFLTALVSNCWKEARGESIIQGRDGG